MLLRALFAALSIALALIGIYLFTLGGNFVYVGIGLYVLCWVIWLFRPQGPRRPKA
jgi:hypothetical protein